MKPKVLILLSDKRSGSTLLQKELCAHADIQTVAHSPHTYLETHHWLKAAVLLNLPAEKFASGKLYPGYGSSSNARTYIEECILENIPDYKIPEEDEALVFEGWEALCQRFAKPVFFEKSPQHLAHPAALELMLEWKKRSTFDVKFITMTRNPLSVQHSAMKLFHTDPDKRQHGWKSIQQNLIDFQQKLSPEDSIHIQYEDLITEPTQTLNKIVELCGLPYDSALGQSVHANSLYKWREDKNFTLQLAPDVAATAKQFGYTDEDLHNPHQGRPSLSYRIKRQLIARSVLTKARVKDKLLKPLKLRTKRRISQK